MTKRLDPEVKRRRRAARNAAKLAKALGRPELARMLFEMAEEAQEDAESHCAKLARSLCG